MKAALAIALAAILALGAWAAHTAIGSVQHSIATQTARAAV